MKTLLAAALMVFGLAVPEAAQSAAVVVGSIVDQAGAPLAGVRVTIRSVAVRIATTGAAGDFAFSDVPDGDYEISAELSGFERARRAVRVLAGERVTVSLALRVAILEETKGRPFQVRRVCLRHGLHGPAGADADRAWDC